MKFESFKPKSNKEILSQVEASGEILGRDICPPDMLSANDIDISSIKLNYKTRYDAYLASLRASKNGHVNSKEIKDAKEWIMGLNNLDTYIKDHESKDDPLLREKQYIVYKRIRDFLEQGKRSGYIKLPTGTGKTILFLKIAEALDMKTLVVSPSTVILDQNANETDEFTDAEHGKYYSKEKDLSNKITHITYHSLVNAIRDNKINPVDYPVIILDEAHRSLGTERMSAIEGFNGLVLGFTATPEFSRNKRISNILNEEIFRMDVAEGIREGLICQTQTIHAYTDIDISNVEVIHGQYIQNQLEKTINVLGRNLAAVKLYQEKFSHLKAFVNCTGVNHAKEVARLFNENNITSACITGDTSKQERMKILNDYRQGLIKVLTNARVLLEGFNEPSCEVTFNLHPTLSQVDAEQRARSGRLDKNNPDKWSYVIDFIDQNSQKPQILYSEILGSDRVFDITESGDDSQNTDPSTERGNPNHRTPPINFENISLTGLRVEVDSQKIMEITKNNIDQRQGEAAEAPPDWLTASDITKKFNFSYHLIRALVVEFKEKYPFSVKLYKGNNGVATEYCSPEVIDEIIEEANKFQDVPPGWLNIDQISKKYNLSNAKVKTFINKHKEEIAESYKVCKSGSQITEFYNLELINLVEKNLVNDFDLAPSGWKTARNLSRAVKSGTNYIEKIATQYRLSHPEWFGQYKSKEGMIMEHFSPEIVEIISKEKKEVEKPDGWSTASKLRDVFKVSDVTIRNFVEQFRAENPNWFHNYQSGSKIMEHYSPELVNIIKEKYKTQTEVSTAPDGWETNSKISINNNIDYGSVKKYAQTFKVSHPEWFGDFKTPKLSEHYSPELIEIIKKHFEEIKAILPPPFGWATSYTLAKELGRDTVKVKAWSLPYRSTHPEWFKQFKTGSMIAEHYSPELVEIIRKRKLNN